MTRHAAAVRASDALRRLGYFAVIVAIGAALLSGCGQKPGQEAASPGSAEAATSEATPVTVTTATRGDIEETLELTGTAEADDEVDVVPEVSGKVARVYVDIGDYISRGQPIVRVDTKIAAAQRDQAAAGVRSAEAAVEQARESLQLTDEQTASGVRQAEVGVATARERLEQARASARMVRSEVESNIQQARTGLSQTETRLAEIKAGAREQQRRQAEAQVRQAKASLDLARQTFERNRRLLEGGVISQQQFDQVRTQYEVAQASHEQALENLSLVEEGARTEQVRLAELAVESARERLALAESARTRIDVVEQDVRAAEEGVRAAQEQLRAARAGRKQIDVQRRGVEAAEAAVGRAEAGTRVASVQLEKHVITAPVSGRIAARMVDPGEAASPGVPVVRIVNNALMYVETSVAESDLKKLSVGQAATITVDALPGETFEGTISALNPSVEPGSRTGTARVRFVSPGERVRAGMFAHAMIAVAQRSATILLDRDALVTEDDETVVFVLEGDRAKRRSVETGLMDEERVEILSGLGEGDRVVIEGQDQLNDGDAVRVRTSRSGEAQ